MATRPRLRIGRHLIPGLVAVALFVVLAVVFLTSSFGPAQGFESGSITANIGYSMFNIDQGSIPAESFLIVFEIIDLVLIAAVAAAVMLARRESDGQLAGPERVRADGGRPSDESHAPESGSTSQGSDRDTNTGVE